MANKDVYAARDRRYTTAAATVTMSKFGPSGSLKKKNMTLENTRDVVPNIINEVFFDLKYMSKYFEEAIQSYAFGVGPSSMSYQL